MTNKNTRKPLQEPGLRGLANYIAWSASRVASANETTEAAIGIKRKPNTVCKLCGNKMATSWKYKICTTCRFPEGWREKKAASRAEGLAALVALEKRKAEIKAAQKRKK